MLNIEGPVGCLQKGRVQTNLNVSFLAVRLAVSISLFVLALLLLTGGTFSFVSAAVPVLPPFSIAVLLTVLVLLLLLLVTVNGTNTPYCCHL